LKEIETIGSQYPGFPLDACGNDLLSVVPTRDQDAMKNISLHKNVIYIVKSKSKILKGVNT
jgi:hypothetical protein